MKKLKPFGLFFGGCVVGAIAISCYWQHIFSQMFVSPQVDFAAQSAFRANSLALLRLGKTEAAIKDVESEMDGDLFAIAGWERVGKLDAKKQKERDKWLVAAKVYHENFSIHGDAETVSIINSLLAEIPGRKPESSCQSALCQLDDQRLAKLNSKTNSP